MSSDEILAAALTLSDDDRERLADQLYASLESATAAGGGDPAIEDAWTTEVEKRLREIDEGTVEMIPWDEVEKEMGEILGDSE